MVVQFRPNGTMTIVYTHLDSPVGPLLIAANDDGLHTPVGADLVSARPFYSLRSAFSGSTFIARCAGSRHAATPTTNRMTTTSK